MKKLPSTEILVTDLSQEIILVPEVVENTKSEKRCGRKLSAAASRDAQVQEIYSHLTVRGENGFIDSRLVAKGFGKRHDNVLQTIAELQAAGGSMLLTSQEHRYKDRRGNTQKCYELSLEDFLLLSMSFNRGRNKDTADKIDNFRRNLVSAFKLLTQRVIQLELEKKANQQDPVLLQIREAGKDSRNLATAEVKELIEYGKRTGAKRHYSTDIAYSLFTNMVYRELFQVSGFLGIREYLSAAHLKWLDKVESGISSGIQMGIHMGLTCSQIYHRMKDFCSSFAKRIGGPADYRHLLLPKVATKRLGKPRKKLTLIEELSL